MTDDHQAPVAELSSRAEVPPPVRRRRRVDSALVREQLVHAAVQEFGEKGYAGATLEAIAERVGLTRQGVLRRFPTKEALFVEVLANQLAWARQQYADASEDGDREGFQLSALRPEVPSGKDPGAPRYRLTMAQVMQGEAMTGEGAARDFAVGRLTSVQHHLTDRVERARRAGRLATEADTAVVATLLAATINGLQAHWLLDDTARTGEAFDLLLSLILQPQDRPD